MNKAILSTILLTILIALLVAACGKKDEEIPKIPVIVTNSNNVQGVAMTPLPPPVPLPTSIQTPTVNTPAPNTPSQDNKNIQGTGKKMEFTPVVSKDNIPTPPSPANQPQTQVNRDNIPAPTINDLGNKTEVVYFGAKETIDGKFMNMERKPEGFLITTTAKKYFINY